MTKRPSVMSLDDFMRPEAAPIAPEPAPVAEPEGNAPPLAEREVPEVEAEAPPTPARKAPPDVFRTSLYFHRHVHDTLREIAFRERLNVSDLINEGLELVLKGRGYPTLAEIKKRGLGKRKRAGVL